MIRQLVRQAFKKGYLSLEVEEQLRELYNAGCTLQDVDALTDLQYAVMCGQVKREVVEIKEECLAS